MAKVECGAGGELLTGQSNLGASNFPVMRFSRHKDAQIDPAIVGTWKAGNSAVRITAEGWQYLAGSAPFSISSDGKNLNYPAPNPAWIFSRAFGSGSSVIGVWKIGYNDGPDTWAEEVHFRSNGTYDWQVFLNGTFDSEYIGNYEISGSNLKTEELRAIVTTGPGAQIVFDPVFGSSSVGSYVVAGDGLSWAFTDADGLITVFIR